MSLGIGNARNSVFAIREESVAGQLIPISAGTQFIPLRPGFSLERTVDELANEELRSGIGEARSVQGKETVSGEYSAYLKHSGIEGQEPEAGLIYESAFGSKTVNATEYDTASGSTISVINVDDGSNFYIGQALLIKDATNGFSIRNIKSISTNALTLNFPIDVAPAEGVNLGKAITYIPEGDGFKTFSAWNYVGNGYAVVANSGNQALGITLELAANQFANASLTFEGQNYRFNPVIIGANNKFIDYTDDVGTSAISIPEQTYNNPIDLAAAIQAAFDADTTETIEVSYSNIDGKFTISTDTSAVLSLLWDSGTNAANSIGGTLGFDVSTDDTGALTYTSDDEQTYEAPFTPSYDSQDPLVVKDAEFYIGDKDNMICRCATTVTIEITKETEDVDCICEETGTKGKIATQRVVNISGELIITKHDAFLFKALKDSDSVQIMLNLGEKQAGNYKAGTCFNFYVPNGGITEFSTAGDNFVVANIAAKGFVDNNKECFLNFL